ncbi:MAG: rhodanese-like domain-containing protein [Acidobacteria bacterium]|nr:rhodanese-like domain-containing protein [Acidobacteriota bacterium]
MQARSVSPSQLSVILATNQPHELIDVRIPPEFAAAHVPGATLIPLDDLRPSNFLEPHRSGIPIFIICQSGARARKAIDQLKVCCCSDAVLVEGGTQAWIDARLPVDRRTFTVIPIVRQVQIVVGSLSVISALLALTVSVWFALIPLLLAAVFSLPEPPAPVEWPCYSLACHGTALT